MTTTTATELVAARDAGPDPTPSIRAVVCDFAGVLTNSLSSMYAAFRQASGISEHEIAIAMALVYQEEGRHPLAELEKGAITEAEFLTRLDGALRRRFGRTADMSSFRETWFCGMRPNEPFLDYIRELGEEGYRLALLTNNVREWEREWRQHLPSDDLFEVTVNSAFVASRKPEPAIYLHLLRLLELSAAECLLVDDVWENCCAARDLGMPVVWFRSNVQVFFDIDMALGRHGRPALRGV